MLWETQALDCTVVRLRKKMVTPSVLLETTQGKAANMEAVSLGAPPPPSGPGSLCGFCFAYLLSLKYCMCVCPFKQLLNIVHVKTLELREQREKIKIILEVTSIIFDAHSLSPISPKNI